MAYTEAGRDELGQAVREPSEEAVGNVLVAPGGQADATAQNRPDGVRVSYTLYFPKEYAGELDGCEVVVRGRRCKVVGHPDRYSPCPTPWNMKCEVSDVEG